VTVKYDVNTPFARAFGMIDPSFNSVFTVTSTAQAAHRPRDVCIVLDYSGSMNNESDLWNNEAYLDNGLTTTTSGYKWPQPSNPNLTSNNVETVYPQFGHYAGSSATAQSNNGNDYSDYSQNPNLLCPKLHPTSPLYNSGLIGKCNVSVSVAGIPAVVNDFYKSDRGAGTVQYAFTSWPDSYAAGTDSAQGDNYLKKGTGSSLPCAATVQDVTGPGTSYDSTWETNGYVGRQDAAGTTISSFKGYTLGPRYWGKTFFIWPPDPTNDWRKKFFFKDDGTTPLDDNTKLF